MTRKPFLSFFFSAVSEDVVSPWHYFKKFWYFFRNRSPRILNHLRTFIPSFATLRIWQSSKYCFSVQTNRVDCTESTATTIVSDLRYVEVTKLLL